jgi:serine/threonine-protein kinase
MSQPTPAIRQAAPEVPAALDGVLERCLEKGPEDRYRDLGELAQALAPFGGSEASRRADYITRVIGKPTRPSGTPRQPPEVAALASRTMTSDPAAARPAPTVAQAPVVPPSAGPGRGVLALGAALVVVLVAVIVVVTTGDEEETMSERASSTEVSAPTPSVTVDDVGGAPAAPPASLPPTASDTAVATTEVPAGGTEPPVPAPAPPPPPAAPPLPPSQPADDWGKFGRSR